MSSSLPSARHQVQSRHAALLGSNGKFVTDAAGATPDAPATEFYGLAAVTDVTITAITLAAGWSGAAAIQNKTLIAGAVLMARFTAISYTGTAALYQA